MTMSCTQVVHSCTGPDITGLIISLEDNGRTGIFKLLFHPSDSVS